MAEAPPPPTTASASDPSSSAAAPRCLPPTLLLPPPSNGSRGAGGGSARNRAAPAGSRKAKAMVSAAGTGARHDQLVEAVRVVGRGVDAVVDGADILELAMAKGPMFSWLSYWPEEGFPKEDHPY